MASTLDSAVIDGAAEELGALFDQAITFRHRELAAVSKTLHELENALRQAD